jgi:TolB-like protein
MNLFAELRRRNVIRMAGLYLVGAWLIVQIAETLLPIFHTPDWVLQTLVVLLALGFIPALVFSWLYELTPDGLKRDADVTVSQSIAAQTGRRMDRLIFVGLVALIAVIAADRFWPRQTDGAEPGAASGLAASAASTGDPGGAAGSTAPGSTGVPPASTPDPGSIAVLPFVNMSADRDNEYFSDGISEELLNVLVKVEGLSVASRTSSFAYKGRELSATAIGSELKVAHVLEGSVRKSGNRVRITAQLIDTGSDRHLWSETFDRELTDIFAIQDEIAKAIVAALRETLGERGTSAAVAVLADTDNVDAYQLYLKARELFLSRTRLDESVRLFEQVVTLDPGFARGWEGLAVASAVIVDWKDRYSAVDPPALLARAQEAADRALALDPTLSLPWAARSLVVVHEVPIDYAAALALVDRAIAADPRNGTAFLLRGILWLNLGFVERALEDYQRCLEIDPAYGNCMRWKALGLLFEGQSDAALALYEQGMAQGFNPNRGNSFIEPLIRRGDVFAARLLMRELEWPVEVQQAMVTALADGKPAGDVAALVRRHPEVARGQFQWGLMLRDYALAADAPQLRSTMVELWDPGYEGLRESATFKRILERFGVPAYWRAHGYPPQCRALGDSDFECDAARPAP